MDYKELLKDGRWQIKKSEIMQRDNYKCRVCGDKAENGITLNVHHLHYRRGAAPWEYDNSELVTLCESCHKKTHDEINGVVYDLKVGDFVRYSHSDFDNFGFVYYIDFSKMTAKIATIDDGSDYTMLWLEIIRIEKDGKLCTSNQRDLIRDKEAYIEDENDENEHGSLGGFMYSCAADCLAHLGEYDFYTFDELDKEEELSVLKANLPLMIENNEDLKSYFNEHDYRVLYQRQI